MKRLFAVVLVIGLGTACSQQKGAGGGAHSSAPASGVAGATALAVPQGDPHAVDRATTTSDYCVACHSWADGPANHPTRVSYLIPASGGGYLNPPDAAIVLREGVWVECSSCHDDGTAGFPRRTVLADLCSACHDKSSTATPPWVSFTTPAWGATVAGLVDVAASASGAVRTELWGGPSAYETSLLASVASGGSVTFQVDTTPLPNGPYVLLVRGYDEQGANGSAYVTLTIDNAPLPPPEVTVLAPAPGALVHGTVQVLATTANAAGPAELWVQSGIDSVMAATAPIQADGTVAFALDTAPFPDGPLVLGVKVRDAAGSSAQAIASVILDGTDPIVALTTPLPDAILRSATTIAATATDANGVASVAFYVDGTLLGTSTAAPFAVAWTPARRSGSHTLTAVATDAAGNAATSPPVVVVVK